MKVVKVYTQPGCQPCRLTEMKLNALGVEFEPIDITQDEKAGDYVRALGALESPVVTVNEGTEAFVWWSGYRVNELTKLREA